jgi:hypothetical protein
MTTDPPFDRAVAHRWFAVELNNRAWDLIEKPQRTDEETLRMIHMAHASYFHWTKIGTPINHLRGLILLATAYIKAGDGPQAVRYAEQCVAVLKTIEEEPGAFDRACAHGCAARAHAMIESTTDAAAHLDCAKLAAKKLTDPEDRQAFERLYGS